MATRVHARPMATAHEYAAPRKEGRQLSLPSLVIICVMVIGLAGLLPLIQTSQVTSTSGDIRQLERARDGWQARLQELQADVATLTSLDRIDKEARQRLGMVSPTETIYITVDEPAPEMQPVPLRFLPSDEEQTHQEDSWWESILGKLPLP